MRRAVCSVNLWRSFLSLWAIKWLSSAALALVVLCTIASLFSVYITIGGAANWRIAIVAGALGLTESSTPNNWPNFRPGYQSWGEFSKQWRYCGLWPRHESRGTWRRTLVPLWIPLVVLASSTLWLWRLDRRRARPGHCPKCGYNLTGNVTGVCSECGFDIGAKP